MQPISQTRPIVTKLSESPREALDALAQAINDERSVMANDIRAFSQGQTFTINACSISHQLENPRPEVYWAHAIVEFRAE